TDRACGFLVLGCGREAELAHRIDDAPLHWLESVAERGQRAVEDDVHRVFEVGLLGGCAEVKTLHALEIQLLVGHYTWTSAWLPLRSNQSRRSPARFFASSMSIMRSVSSRA